jgi:glycosyltransferase involved in cell wall biosynthesis
MPKISVITPVYNCEAFIEESISSILGQSFSDFEFIIINDGSTDRTSDLIKSFDDSRIRFVDYQENKGVLARSKEAVDLAVTEYIAIHDADDVSMSNRLELQFNYLEENPDIFCVGGRAKKIDLFGKLIGDWNFPPVSHKEMVRMLMSQSKCPIINPSSMYRLSGYKELGGYSPDNSIKYTHDLDFWCRAILDGKRLANLQDYLIKYRVNPCGMTRKNKVMQLADHITVMSTLKKRMKNVKF